MRSDQQNPYAAPTAHIGNGEQTLTAPVPASIRRAVALIYIAAAGTVLLPVVGWLGLLPVSFDVLDISIAAVTAALVAFCGYASSRGRSWPRWILLVTLLIGTVSMLLSMAFSPEAWTSMPLVLVLNSVFQTVIQFLATVFLFVGNSRAWFRSRKAA
jgi:hypothetical protein